MPSGLCDALEVKLQAAQVERLRAWQIIHGQIAFTHEMIMLAVMTYSPRVIDFGQADTQPAEMAPTGGLKKAAIYWRRRKQR